MYMPDPCGKLNTQGIICSLHAVESMYWNQQHRNTRETGPRNVSRNVFEFLNKDDVNFGCSATDHLLVSQ